jgi:hypothetical protein
LNTAVAKAMAKDPRKTGKTICIYEACIIALAELYQNYSLPLLDPAPQISDTGRRLLYGAHVRIMVASGFSVILGIRKLLGIGDRGLGWDVITFIITDGLNADSELVPVAMIPWLMF